MSGDADRVGGRSQTDRGILRATRPRTLVKRWLKPCIAESRAAFSIVCWRVSIGFLSCLTNVLVPVVSRAKTCTNSA